MKRGDTVVVEPQWSISGKEEEALILSIDYDSWSAKIEYSNGYKEWLPISAFRGY